MIARPPGDVNSVAPFFVVTPLEVLAGHGKLSLVCQFDHGGYIRANAELTKGKKASSV